MSCLNIRHLPSSSLLFCLCVCSICVTFGATFFVAAGVGVVVVCGGGGVVEAAVVDATVVAAVAAFAFAPFA